MIPDTFGTHLESSRCFHHHTSLHQCSAFYHLFEFTANPEFIKSFELAFRRDERVLRYLTVKLDRWGVDFNQRKRNGELRTVTPQGEKVVVKKKVVIEEEEL